MKTIEDLHPHDLEVRVNLRADLITRRYLLGGQRELGRRLGVTQPVVARIEGRLQWRLSTVQRWARALDAQARFVLVGLPEPWHVHGHPGHDLELPDGPPEDADRWLRSKVIADAIGARFAAGVQLSHVARLAGCTYNTMSQWEDDAEDDTRLPVLQRYVRATAVLARIPGAHLAVDLDTHPPIKELS